MNLLTAKEIENFKTDGAIVLRKKFDISWIEKLKIGIKKDIKSPSPRFKSHTIQKNIPAYLEDYWTWDRIPEFKDFVFNSTNNVDFPEDLSFLFNLIPNSFSPKFLMFLYEEAEIENVKSFLPILVPSLTLSK